MSNQPDTSTGASPVGTTSQIAAILGGDLRGNPDLGITRLEALHLASASELTFIRDESFASKWPASGAGAAIVSRDIAIPAFDEASRAVIFVDDADLAVIKLLDLVAQVRAIETTPGIHPSATVDPEATVDPSAEIGPHCWVGPGAFIGAGTRLGSGVSIDRGVRVGARCVLHPRVVLQQGTRVGDDCVIHPGTVIGADGFGYRPSPDGKGLLKIPHIGGVRIGNHVEIGANSAIDKGKFGDTIVGDGTKIDNLVQLAHNCHVGRCVVICGQCAIAGSVTIGDGAILGGACNIPDGVVIEAGAKLGGAAQVAGNVRADGEFWIGAPARPAPDAKKLLAAIALLPKTRDRIKSIEQRLRAIESALPSS